MELWTATLLKVYIIETQWKTCYSKLEKLLFFFTVKNILVIFVHECLHRYENPTGHSV